MMITELDKFIIQEYLDGRAAIRSTDFFYKCKQCKSGIWWKL